MGTQLSNRSQYKAFSGYRWCSKKKEKHYVAMALPWLLYFSVYRVHVLRYGDSTSWFDVTYSYVTWTVWPVCSFQEHFHNDPVSNRDLRFTFMVTVDCQMPGVMYIQCSHSVSYMAIRFFCIWTEIEHHVLLTANHTDGCPPSCTQASMEAHTHCEM